MPISDQMKIDNSPELSFESINILITYQNKILKDCNQFYLDKEVQFNTVLDHFNVINSALLAEPEMYHLLEAGLNQSDVFKKWFATLSEKKQEKIVVRFYSDNNVQYVQLGNKEKIKFGEFGTETYNERVRSHWLNNIVTNNQNQDEVNTAQQLEKFIRDERICATKIAVLRVLIEPYLNNHKLKPNDKKAVSDFLQLLNEYQEAYKKLNLHELFNPDNQSVEEVLQRFIEKYSSKVYILAIY